jgi:glycogen operon protein
MATSRWGDPHVFGATWDGQGTNFAVFSSAAAHDGAVELCLLDGQGGERRVPMTVQDDVWSVYLSDAGPGQEYGYRASGTYDPARGLRFDPQVLLLDPYAKAMTPVDDAQPRLLHSLVAGTGFDWSDDRPPNRPWCDTVLYEAHVKGITATHPEVPAELRGTYAGLAHPAVVAHLRSLGVSAVELMPVHQFVSEQFVLERGLVNYWGYSTIGFFAPHAGYSSAGSRGGQLAEFQNMVKTLHAAGLEVILDIVYNHTAEGSADAPALSFRGLANDVYYRHDPDDPGRYVDTTGTLNSLDTGRPEVLRLIMDSLRYWVTVMHVDGFRFDLAASLARQHGYVDRLSSFFALLHQDPVLNRVKLIAEPWDIAAPDGYQVGRFPAGWNEWNDRYRDGVRDFWRGRGSVADLGYRLTGSSDLYGGDRRGPDASVNFVTAHDGKTLADLVTYVGKYNEANGENNHDGAGDDRADNYGVEGLTDRPEINDVRRRQWRNLLATLLLSQGTPMICGGDEIGRTQRGNNNAYCQDNPVSWYDWDLDAPRSAMLAFTRRVVALQLAHPALRRRAFLTGNADIGWYDRAGAPMTERRWLDPAERFLAFLLAGDRVDGVDDAGLPRADDDVLVVLNAGTEPVEFPMPGRPGAAYRVVLDTGAEDGDGGDHAAKPGDVLRVTERSVLVAVSPLAAKLRAD